MSWGQQKQEGWGTQQQPAWGQQGQQSWGQQGQQGWGQQGQQPQGWGQQQHEFSQQGQQPWSHEGPQGWGQGQMGWGQQGSQGWSQKVQTGGFNSFAPDPTKRYKFALKHVKDMVFDCSLSSKTRQPLIWRPNKGENQTFKFIPDGQGSYQILCV